MKRVIAIVAGLTLGVGIMLGVLQPWKRVTIPPVPPQGINHWRIDWFAEAREDIDAGRIDQARRILARELEDDPRSALALALLALADIRTGEVDGAQLSLARAAALEPNLFEVAFFQGHLEMLLADRSAARRSYTEALKRRPGDAKALAGRAAARFELGEHAGAVEDATAAIAKEPDALFTRAAAYGELGRHEESLRDWTAYLAGHPKDAHAWMNRGNAHERLGRKEAAVADWKQAVKLDPKLGEKLEPLIEASR